MQGRIPAAPGSAGPRPYREVLEAKDGDDSGQEADDHGAEGRQHHFAGRPRCDAAGQGGILDVDLHRMEAQGKV